MKSGLCSSSAISSSRRSRTFDPRWRRPRRPARLAETGSPACACAESSRAAAETPRGRNRSLPCRTPGSARRRRAARTRTPPPPPPPPPRARDRSKTSCGRSSTLYNERVYDYAMRRNCCEENSTRGSRKRRKSPSRERCPPVAGTAPTWAGCGASETLCWRARRSSRLQPRPLRRRRPPPPWAGWTAHWTRRRGRRASPRPTPRSSLRFSSRAIPLSFNDSYSFPPFRIRLV